ncbi:hypothetical protein SPV_2512 [Streptococcus pneumoniae]|nr:hypothetical protein SPV_2512 [Streptococcus pneumoniae]
MALRMKSFEETLS